MINAVNLNKYFGKSHILTNCSLHVKKGAVYGLVGPNGAGKTTLINHITGILRPNSGNVIIDGQPVFENPHVKSRMFYISDSIFSFSSYSAYDMSVFYQSVYPSFSRKRYDELAEIFTADDRKPIRHLSKGMKKHISFRLALSCMPDILVLDEALDGLDPIMRRHVLSLIISDVKKRDMTVLLSSHNLRELDNICDHIGIIYNGKTILEKSLDEICSNIQKYQLCSNKDISSSLRNMQCVLSISVNGSFYSVITKGNAAKTEAMLSSLSPIVLERTTLTLEEIFIYETGGMEYDFSKII